jgi:hypothetical protein
VVNLIVKKAAFPWAFDGAPASGIREKRMIESHFGPDRESGLRSYFGVAFLFRAELVQKFGLRWSSAGVDDQHVGARLR